MDEQDEVKIQMAWVERWCPSICDYVYHSMYQGPPSLDAIEALVVKTFTTTFVDRQSPDLTLPTGFEAKVRHKILSQLAVGLGSKGETAMTEQEKAAIELLKQGHEEAWHQFVEALGPTLHRRLLELTGDADKANDYMGEIFLLIVRSIGKIR